MSTMDESTADLERINPISEVSQKRKKIGKKSGLPGNHGASEVWAYFTKQVNEGTKKYSGVCSCNFCHLTIDAPSSSGTNKLWGHIKGCKEFPGFEGDKTQTLISFKGSQATSWMFDQEQCRRSLARMIIRCELPFNLVEKEGFRLFCEELQPKFHVLSRSTVTKDYLQMYYEEKSKLMDYFKLISPRVCITTDMWTSIQNLGYIVLTAHFVDKDWKLQKKIINFRVLPHPHTGEVIAKAVEECLLEWGLTKVMTITLDNAKNNDTCVEELIKRLKKRNALLLDGGFFHVRCFAHVVNLVVRDGIDEVKESIKTLRRTVKYVRSGPSRMQIFKKCALDEKVSTKKALCLDVKTRWNSTYLMIDAALEYERAFDRLVEEDTGYKNECLVMGFLKEDDWKKMKSLHTFLEDFYEITKRVSGSKYVTSNSYFDEVTQVKDLIIDHLCNKDAFFLEMARKMNTKFEKYCDFRCLNLILVVSIVLDPRYKMQYVEFWYTGYLDKQAYSEEEKAFMVEGLVKRVKDLMGRLYECYKVESADNDLDTSSKSNAITSSLEKTTKRLKVKEDFRGFLKMKDHVEATQDLDRYLAGGVENDEHEFNVLAWWHGKSATYHVLAIIARDILAIPVTSVASESAFSTAGRVLDAFRSSLTPNIVEALVCAQDWLGSSLSFGVEEKVEALEEIEKGVINEISIASSLQSSSGC